MKRALGTVAILLGGALLSGCATVHSASLTQRLVHEGEPALDVGGPPMSPENQGAVEHAVAQDPPRATAFGRTIEDSDPGLAAALLVEAALPTASNHIRVATEYRRLGIFDAAFERLTQAVALEPRSAKAHEAIARAWRDWGLPGRALGPAQRAAYFDGGSAGAQNTLGTVLDALGQLEGARDAYARALLLDPTAAWALNNMCYVDFRIGRLNDARLHCEAALRLQPETAATQNNLALIHAATGDLALAREKFFAGGDVATAQYNLGIVYLAQGDVAAAARAFEEAIRSRPTFTAAKVRAHAARLRLITGSN